jgi:hypothetical protein
MKNTKHQKPNTKEPSNSKPEPAETYVTRNRGCAWVLKDEEPPGPEQRHPFDFE